MAQTEYYNVVIYNEKDGQPEGVQLKALTKDEIKQYFDYVKIRKLGMQPIGSHNENVVIPYSVRIFSFSKKSTLNGENQAIHRKSIADRAKSLGDFLTACEEYGQELDMKNLLGFNLFDILNGLSPEPTDEDDSEPNKYFNLYIETPNKDYSEQEIYNTFGYTVLDKKEINQYIDLLKRKSWGEHTIGQYTIQVTPPTDIKIFDLSNVVHKGDDYTREELIKMVPLNPDDKITLYEQFESYGVDVTKEMFGEDIDILLNNLQLDIQLAQRGINAGTGEKGTFFTEGEMKGQSNGGSSTGGNLGDRTTLIYPKEFEEGILDGSVEPAFNVEKIASVFANHLKNLRYENGQMIGVFGQWGRGKSYFVRQVFKKLNLIVDEKETRDEETKWNWFIHLLLKNNFNPFRQKNNPSEDENIPFLLVQFQAWKYQTTPSIWAYLYETVINEYLNVNRGKKLFRIFKLNNKRNGKWKSWIWPVIVIIFGILWILVFNFNDKLQGFNFFIKWSGGLVSFLTIVFKLSYFGYFSKDPAIRIFNTISKVPSFKSILGVQAEIQKELVSLIQSWIEIIPDKRILLFIDDLDRYSEHQLMDIVDSLRVIIDDEKINKNLLVLVALDEEKLIVAINEKYKKLTEKEKNSELANEYLDKLFISALKLCPISDDERAEFIRKIAKQINPVEVKSTKTGEEQAIDKTSSEETEFDEEIINGKEESEGTVDSDQNDESEVIPVMADFKSKTGQQQNLDKTEIDALTSKIKITKTELTPRQIRIVVYRYLLARNLWLAFYGNINWKTDDAIGEIMRLSGYSKEDVKAETKINGGLFKICQMVVAY